MSEYIAIRDAIRHIEKQENQNALLKEVARRRALKTTENKQEPRYAAIQDAIRHVEKQGSLLEEVARRRASRLSESAENHQV
jgi:predicted nuclease with TOPRIM domain